MNGPARLAGWVNEDEARLLRFTLSNCPDPDLCARVVLASRILRICVGDILAWLLCILDFQCPTGGQKHRPWHAFPDKIFYATGASAPRRARSPGWGALSFGQAAVD